MKIVVLCLFLLTGCSVFTQPIVAVEGPIEPPDKNRYFVQFDFTDNPTKDCAIPGKKVDGCANFGGICNIKMRKNDWKIIIHELQHCFHGSWHPE